MVQTLRDAEALVFLDKTFPRMFEVGGEGGAEEGSGGRRGEEGGGSGIVGWMGGRGWVGGHWRLLASYSSRHNTPLVLLLLCWLLFWLHFLH